MNLDDLSILPQTETARGVHDREFIIFINKIKNKKKIKRRNLWVIQLNGPANKLATARSIIPPILRRK